MPKLCDLGCNILFTERRERYAHPRPGQDDQEVEEFYTNLYSTKLPQGQPSVKIHNTRSTPPPPILLTEVSVAIKRLKRNKAPGNDNITADVLKDGREPIVQMFTNNVQHVPQGRQTPKQLDHNTQEGRHSQYKKLQTDKLATSHVQDVLSGDPA